MTAPSNKELLRRFQKIQESDGPEANAGFKTGGDVGIESKDDHSAPVKQVRKPGSDGAEESYDGSDKEVETKTGNKREAGAEKAPEEFEGSEAHATEASNDKRKAGGKDTVPAAQGASKEFAAFRNRIRSAMGMSLDDKKNKGNDGSLH